MDWWLDYPHDMKTFLKNEYSQLYIPFNPHSSPIKSRIIIIIMQSNHNIYV